MGHNYDASTLINSQTNGKHSQTASKRSKGGSKQPTSSGRLQDLRKQMQTDSKFSRALHIKLQNSSKGSKKSIIRKDNSSIPLCTQKTLSISKLKQYSSNKKGLNARLRQYLNVNCDKD